MKKILIWLLGIFLVLAASLAVVFALKWPTARIIMGTGGLSGETDTIPEPRSDAADIPLNEGEADWTSWQGPNGDNRSLVTGIRTDWTGGLDKHWEIEYLCQDNSTAAWSAPVVKGNRLVVCGRDADNDLVFCLDTSDGSLLWLGSYEADAGTSHGSGPRATPYIDGDRVYTFGRAGDLVCWNLLDGEMRWTTNVVLEGGMAPQWGFASSPLVLGDRVIVQAGGSARTIAYDKMTGKMLWKSGSGIGGYAAITTMDIDSEPIVLTFHGTGLSALDPGDGAQLWNVPWETSYNVNATTPISSGDTVFITSGYKTGGMLLRADRIDASTIWQNDVIAAQHSDPFFIDGYLYGYSGDSSQNKGAFKCVNPANGNEIWSTNDMGWGTCVFADGHLICLDIKGNLFIMKPDPARFTKVSEIERALGDVRGPVWTKPVLANGNLYLRFKQRLVCYNILP